MQCTLLTHGETREILFFPNWEGVVFELEEDKVKEIQECEYNRVQQLLNTYAQEYLPSSLAR